MAESTGQAARRLSDCGISVPGGAFARVHKACDRVFRAMSSWLLSKQEIFAAENATRADSKAGDSIAMGIKASQYVSVWLGRMETRPKSTGEEVIVQFADRELFS